MTGSQTTNELVKCIIRETLYNSLAQAIIKIIQTPHIFLKLVLITCVLSSSGLAAYMVIQSILSYLAYDVTTTSRTIHEMSPLFPKITVCNLSPFTTGFALNFLKQINAQSGSQVNLFDANQTRTLNYATLRRIMTNILNIAVGQMNSRQFNDSDRKLLAHNFDDILISCIFNGQSCNSSDFLWSYDSYYGNCYVFNSGFDSGGNEMALKTATSAGWFYGLQLELYANYNQSLSLVNSLARGAGILLRIENSSYLTEQANNGVPISTGARTSVIVDREFKYTLPNPYSSCEVDSTSPKVIDSDLYNLIAQSQYEYSQQMCFGQCLQRETAKRCNCSFAYVLSMFTQVNTCVTQEQINCSTSFFLNGFSKILQSTCVPLCPLECNATLYKTRLRMSQLKGDLFATYINQNANLSADFLRQVDADMASKSVVAVNVFYDSLSYGLSVENAKMDVVSLLASIGGNLGLFLGLSSFSIYEIVQVVIEIFFIKVAKTHPKKSNP